MNGDQVTEVASCVSERCREPLELVKRNLNEVYVGDENAVPIRKANTTSCDHMLLSEEEWGMV